MGVRRSGFALMVVLLAVVAVFGLVVQSVVIARSRTLEVGAMHERAVGERRAQAAVVIALMGMTPADGGVSAVAGTDEEAGMTPPVAGGAGVDDDGIELPEMLLSMVPGLREVDEQAQDKIATQQAEMARVSQGSGMGARVPVTPMLTALNRVGIPADEVRIDVEGRSYRVWFRDALGQLNINKADEEQLQRYFHARGLTTSASESVTQQILDWRDVDSVRRSAGMEQGGYDRLGISCRNGDFAALEELLLLPAIDEGLFRSIAGDLVLGGDGRVHVGSASRAVLMSIPGMTGEAVQSIIERRQLGALTKKDVLELLPPTDRDKIMDRLRIETLGLLLVRVEALDGGSERVIARFDGLALLGPQGVQEVGLRAL